MVYAFMAYDGNREDGVRILGDRIYGVGLKKTGRMVYAFLV